jgi:hypothetical protein
MVTMVVARKVFRPGAYDGTATPPSSLEKMEKMEFGE